MTFPFQEIQYLFSSWICQENWGPPPAPPGPLPAVPGAPALPLLQRAAVDDGWPSNGHRDQRADLHAVSDARGINGEFTTIDGGPLIDGGLHRKQKLQKRETCWYDRFWVLENDRHPLVMIGGSEDLVIGVHCYLWEGYLLTNQYSGIR